jgi:hypothetical protein
MKYSNIYLGAFTEYSCIIMIVYLSVSLSQICTVLNCTCEVFQVMGKGVFKCCAMAYYMTVEYPIYSNTRQGFFSPKFRR